MSPSIQFHRAMPVCRLRSADIFAPMHARALEEASSRLRQITRAIRDGAALTIVMALLAGAVLPVSRPIGGAVAIAAVVEAIALGVRFMRRHQLLEQLALVPAAYEIPDVAEYGRKATRRRERERMAEAFERILSDGVGRPVLWLPERVAALEIELRAVSEALRTAGSTVQPRAMIACRQLVTNPVRSGLYNPNLPIEDVRMSLQAITRTLAAGRESA
jgi:hypothetical protein